MKASKEQIAAENCLAVALYVRVVSRLKHIGLTEAYLVSKLALATSRGASWWLAKNDNVRYVVTGGASGLPSGPSAQEQIKAALRLMSSDPILFEAQVKSVLRPTVEGFWAGWLVGVEPTR